MAENLKVTRYADGTSIKYVTGSTEWNKLSANDAAYCYYNNNINSQYGTLYTYEAAKKAAPNGWHLPTDEEWKQLEKYLGMSTSEADKSVWRGTNEGSKFAGNAELWSNGDLENNTAFGTSGFNALPSGFRNQDGLFYYLGSSANF